MISCQVEPFPHFSFPQTLSVSTPSQVKRLNTLLQLMTSLSLQVNHSLQKRFLAHPFVKRGHFKNSREWSDHKTNGFKLTWFRGRSAIVSLSRPAFVFYRLHPLNT